MRKLYPLQFKPIYLEKIWGGNRIARIKNVSLLNDYIGESWEISGIESNTSVVSNGFLKGNTINELLEIYMGDLAGEKIYEMYGNTFPLLIKLIDANDDLSVQVHPGDELAREKHNSFGKTELWYIIDSEPGSKLINGFSHEIDKYELIKRLNEGNLQDVLNFEDVKGGDCFFIPSGRIHSVGKGILLAEIQQIADITYRVYDWNRVDKNGKSRELHVDLAIDALDFKVFDNYRLNYTEEKNKSSLIKKCNYFTINSLLFNRIIDLDYYHLDTFIIYMCVDGKYNLIYDDNKTITLKKGDTVLIPCELNSIKLEPVNETRLLEIYIE